MGITAEESNVLRFYFLNLKFATKAVRVYFDKVHPPAGLASELANSSATATLKGLRFMTKLQQGILYPSPATTVSSADFDTTLIVCLLRNMPPNESAPVTGWNNLPLPGDTSIGADLVRVQLYRNQLVHSKDGILSSTDFNHRWSDLEGAIGRLGGSSLLKEAQSAQHIVLDKFLEEMLKTIRETEKAVQDLNTLQEKHTDMINDLQISIENQKIIKEQHENKIQQLHDSLQKGESASSNPISEISKYKETIDKCTEKIESLKKVIEKNEETIKGIQEKVVDKQHQVDDSTHQLFRLECKYDKHFKEIDEKLVEHDEKVASCVKEIDNIKKKHYHTNDKSGGSIQRRLEEDTRALIEEDVKEDTFVATKAVTDGLALLIQSGVLLITGHAGTGKSRVGRHILHMFCTENKSLKCIKLTLAEWENITNNKEEKDDREENMDNREENIDNSVDNIVLLLDDIFGETYCMFNREKDTSILDKIYAYVCKGNIKVIITIRDTVKRQCQALFDSHRLFKFGFIDLSSNNYVLSYEEKHSILMKYMKIVRQSDFSYSKGFSDCNGGTVLDNLEILKIIKENPVKGFPLVVYQFVHNDKYFHLRSTFFDRPTEAMLEEMNEIRRKGQDNNKFMIQYAVMVYTAINGNCLKFDDSSNIAALQKIIDAIYGQPIKIIKCNILDAIKELKGSYLINIPNQRSYRFHHQTLQESVILSFAQVDEENIKKIIPLISFSFFLKMVKPKSYKEKDEEVVLMIPTNSFKVLADRLANIYIAEFSVYHSDTFFLYNLSNTEIFQQEYDNLLPCLVEALEKEANKDIYTENMIRSVVMDTFDYVRSNVHIKNTDLFFAYLLDTVAKSENQLDVYYFVLKIFKKMINTSSSRMSVDYTKFALISSLYVICATKDVRCVKATLDMIEEHKIPVLVDQGVILTEVPNITSKSTFGEEYDDETCVFLTLCIWNAYKVCNIPVLEFLLSKYNQTQFDINLFFKMIYKDEWTHNMIPSFRKRGLGRPTLSFEPLKWMIETFPDQELEDPNFILRAACKYQMFDTVEYLASGTKPISRISCLKAFLNKPESLVGIVPFSQELFSFLIKQIDMSSEGLIPFVSSVIQKLDIPDYMFDAVLPVCINNANIFRLACENGQFYLVKLIIESSQIEHLDIQSALVAACKESEITQHHSVNHEKADDEVAKLEIVKYIVDKIGFHQFDLIAICQQACSTKKIKIIEWFLQNIDTTRLDVYTIIDAALVCNRSDILERQMQNIELESLDKKRILRSVNKLIIDTRIETEHFTAEYHTTIMNVLHTIWYHAEVKEELLMKEIVKTAYARKYFKLLMWIHENCRPHISIDSKHVLMLACGDCRVDLAKWVLQNFEQNPLKDEGAKLLMLACQKIRYTKNIMRKDHHLSNDIKEKYWKEVGNKLESTVNWILATFEILPLDIISFVKELINVNEKIRNELSILMVSLFEKYQSCLKKEDITKIINKSLEQKCYVLVNWFLEKCGSRSIFKQMVLEKACADNAIETIKILSNYFYTLNLNQAMIKACTSTYSIFGEFLHKEKGYTEDQHVACLNLLWNEINKIGRDSIDIRTIVSLVCREKKVRNNVMTWILLNLPLDQSLVNEVLITCCQQGQFHHVKYIVHEVNNEKLDIKEAFVMACREFPMFQSEHFKSLGGFGKDLLEIKYDGPSYLMIVDYLFQITNDKDSYLSLVVSEIFEKTKFELILYFLREGYCRNTNMKNLLKKACTYGYVRLVQWILGNVEHKELDIKSAFIEACVSEQHRYFILRTKTVNPATCLALMWHYIHDINMFEIDTVLKTITDSQSFTSDDELKTWLLYMRTLKQRIYKSDSELLNTEDIIYQQDSQDNDDSGSSSDNNDCPSPMKRLGSEKEEQDKDDSKINWFYKLDMNCDGIDMHCIMDERLGKKYGNLSSLCRIHVPLDWFYKLDLNCDGIDMHCIIDQRLERKYGNLSSLCRIHVPLEHFLDSHITRQRRQIKHNSLSEFEYIYSNKTSKYYRDCLLMIDLIKVASTNKYYILLRWLIAHIQVNDMTVEDIKNALNLAIDKRDRNTAKALSWFITRNLFSEFETQLAEAIDIYPGIRCLCPGSLLEKNPFCTNIRVIVILTRTTIREIPDKYHGFEIEEINPDLSNSIDSEAVTISNLLSTKYTNSYSLKADLSQYEVETVFNCHSNITLICPSVLKSKSFSKVHDVQERICIQLYCTKKGIIPLGEDHFPRLINGIPTDVIDGNIGLMTKLRIGDQIGPTTSIGTLGGFVAYYGFNCFLTCAHVMYDVQALLSDDFALLPEAKAYCHSVQGLVDCGKVIRILFDHDDKLKTSIDAALVYMQNNATFDRTDYILDRFGNACPYTQLGLSTPFLNDCCLDREDFCIPHQTATVVGAGSQTKLEQNVIFPKQSDVDILFSSIGQTATVVNGNVFQPLWINSPAHMQIATGILTEKRIFRMYNQIIVNLGLQPGDSGTCIYVVQHPFNNNGCIGMAIAFCGGMTVVTPLKDILKHLNR